MPLTKSDLIDQLSTLAKLPRGTAEQIVNTIFDSMVDALVREQRIEIRGFGSFEVRSYKAYTGRNPRTGEPVEVAPKKLPFFKVGKDLRERVDRGTGTIENDGDSDDDDDMQGSEVGNGSASMAPSNVVPFAPGPQADPPRPAFGEGASNGESRESDSLDDGWDPPSTDY